MDLFDDMLRALEPADLVGYASSCLLLLTIGHQIHRQWRLGTSKGVSVFLFVGQLAASVGFTAYSVLVENVVFVFTNATLACAAAIGLTIVLYHRRRESRASAAGKDVARERRSVTDIDVHRVGHQPEGSLVTRA